MSFCNIDALSWDIDFKDFVYRSLGTADVRIHSIFKRVINIISNDKVIYTISNINTDNAPYTLKIDFNGNFNEAITKIDKVIIEDGSIIVGNIKINLLNAEVWTIAAKRIKDYSSLNIEKNIDIFNRSILLCGENGGCKNYYLNNFLHTDFNSASLVEEQLGKKIDLFYKNLSHNSLNKDHIKNLIGLGIGLTPSGDDFLTGFLASINIFEKNNDLHKKISGWIYPLLNTTTDISAAMLKAAIENKYRESLSEFVYSFLEADEQKFISNFNNLLSIGSSSGTDLSIGVILGLIYTVKNS